MGNAKKTTAAKKTSSSAKASVARTAPPIVEPTAAVVGSAAAYSQYLATAQAIPASAVIPFRASASLAYHNASIGVAALQAQASRVAAELPKVDLAALTALPTQCLALVYAVDQTLQAQPGKSTTLAAQLAQALPLRRKLFAAADALVEAGLFPAQPVAELHKGRGKIDAANDLVGLAALFQQNAAAIKGKTAVTASDASTAASLGTSLLTILKPSQARHTRAGAVVEAADVRNRMWTLVVQNYAALWGACAYLYGPDAIDEKVPPLQARAATTSKRKKANAAKKAAAAPAASVKS